MAKPIDLETYRRALDEVLLTGEVQQLRAFMVTHNAPGRFALDEVVEITMHKTITASVSLPSDYRKRSKAWLVERGYMAWDDGDL